MKALFAVIAALAVGLSAVASLAADLGDAAPPLKVETWLKGNAINLSAGKGKNIYVVEFWATWCGPCVKGIPHLTEIQKKHAKDNVVVIGVSIDSKGDRSKLPEFVRNKGETMNYTVALDDANQSTQRAYMEAFGVRSIPTAFIVDKEGRIVWFGNPARMDGPLAEVIAGTYDIAAAKQAAKAGQKAGGRTTGKGGKKGESLQEKLVAYFAAVSLDEKPKEADKLGQEIYVASEGSAEALQGFAHKILTDENLKHRDLALALKAAERAYELSKANQTVPVLDTYARALFEVGRIKEAIKQVNMAIAKAGKDTKLLTELRKSLKKYEEALRKRG